MRLNWLSQKENPRTIKYGVAHATASHQTQTVEEIQAYWKNTLKWKSPGYHFIIPPNGEIIQLATLDKIANGVKDNNAHSIHFSYIGGIDSKGKPVDNRTDEQKTAQLYICTTLKGLYPNIVLLGHRDFSRDQNGNGKIDQWEQIKACPCFDLRDWLTFIRFNALIIPSGIVYKLNDPLVYNDKVKEIQQALNKYLLPRMTPLLKVDGYFGSKTDLAVRRYQEDHKLPVTGVVDRSTATLLGIML